MERARYAVLRHEGVAQPHHDFLVERTSGGALAAWRAASWPLAAGDTLAELPDHRRDYLEYEGPVSGDRGFVKRVAGGWCEVERGPDRWELRVEGSVVRLDRTPEKGTWVVAS